MLQGYKESKKYIAAQGKVMSWHSLCTESVNWATVHSCVHVFCVWRRPKGGDCEWFLEDDLGAAVVHYRHGNALWRGKQGEKQQQQTFYHFIIKVLYQLWLILPPLTCCVTGQVCAVLAVSRARDRDLWGVYSEADLGGPLSRLHNTPSQPN